MSSNPSPGNGDDVVTDWSGRDTFEVTSGAGRLGRLDLSETDDGVLVSWKSTSVLLLGVELDDLGREDFVFG